MKRTHTYVSETFKDNEIKRGWETEREKKKEKRDNMIALSEDKCMVLYWLIHTEDKACMAIYG